MDKATRTLIQRATRYARQLLEDDFREQIEGTFDILLDGTIAPEPGSHLSDAQKVQRRKLVAAIAHKRAVDTKSKEAVDAFLREAAFTTLNRLVALKMLEARGLVQECLSRCEESSGFKEYMALAPGLTELPDHGYRSYIEALYDEIGREVRVLFDRRDPAGLLWPARQTLNALLSALSAPELAGVWGEDETIGWVFQYFNGDDERKAMRDASQAPRNSRELAVRNQFFTPRYVVQFLVDNSLGRTWYEMMQGQTRLQHLDYLVRRQHEVFLAEGQVMPPEPEGVNQGESVEHPFPIRFRAKKDPRDLKILDPACGSGHFLLYTFDLLLVIYEEAWQDHQAAVWAGTGHTLREDYANLVDLTTAAPALILRHNLHAIDIDHRATQIAALALWLRAQRAFQDQGLPNDGRPTIVRTNVVVAEPMPGEADLLKAFTAALESRLGKLVAQVFGHMKLAGEAGYLLRIDRLMTDEIKKAFGAAGGMYASEEEKLREQAGCDLRAELERFSTEAAGAQVFARQLFAEDAARGLGFIDVCSQRYDAILMNPPFGAFSMGTRDWAKSAYPRTKNDIYAAFVERGIEVLHPRAYLGAITSRTGFFLSTFQKWREEILLKEAPPIVVADLGYGVMDDAMVEAAAYCLEVAE